MAISKWTVLVLACFLTFGAYYSFDFPSVLHNQLYNHFKTDNESYSQFEFDFSLIYSVYSLPNTFIPLIGGLLVDKFGNKKIMFVFGAFVLLGNVIQSYACVTRSMTMYIVGRFVFGFGAETLGVCGNTIISKWFKGQELAFAMAINLSACKLAGVMNDWISPTVESDYGVVATSYSVTIICFVCFLLTVLLIVWEPAERPLSADEMDRRQDDLTTHEDAHNHVELGRVNCYQNADTAHEHSTSVTRSSNSHNMSNEYQEFRTVTKAAGGRVTGDEELIRHSIITTKRTPSGHTLNEESVVEYYRHSSDNSAEESLHRPSCCAAYVGSMMQLNSAVWIIFVLTFLMYGVFIPFTNLSNPILLQFFFPSSTDLLVIQKNQINAAWLQSVPYFLSVLLNPILGISIDYIGRRTFMLTLSAVLLFFGHGLIYFHNLGPMLPLVLIGLSYSVFASVVWACVPMVVRDELTGTAFGLMAAFQNTAQFIVPLLLQHLYADSNSYLSCEGFFMFSSAVAFVLSLLLWVIDERYFDGVMRRPSADSPESLEYNILHTDRAECIPEHHRMHTASIDSTGSNGSSGFVKRSSSASGRAPSTSPYSSRHTDTSISPETTLLSAPIAIIAIPNTVTSDFALRSPMRALIAGQFPVSDPLELRRQMSERSRLVPPTVAYSLMTPSSYLQSMLPRGAGGKNIPVAEGIACDYSDSGSGSDKQQEQQQFLSPRKLTRSSSFHSFRI